MRYPRLLDLAIKVLLIPGISDKPERVFLGSQYQIPWDCTITKTETLEAAEYAKNWSN